MAVASLCGAAGCGGAAARGPATPVLRIAAAADLQYAMGELIEAFRAEHPGAEVRVSFGSSGTLFAQLENGAPFDLYLAADVAYAERLRDEGLVAPGGVFTYAVGRIVVWVPDTSTLDVEGLGMEALIQPSVRTVAIANPDHAPYGRAAVAAMRAFGVYPRVKGRLVLGENIAQTAQFVQTGAADVGIIALSLALAPGAGGRWWEIPAEAHPPILQGGAIMRRARDPGTARAFVRLLQGPVGRRILARYGFEEPS
ncbi:MAG TPA: molybdate ABC transporter substrate-binding protein [Actinomycetota bacterium]|nr:molybdate ABC transporter substrate-binding protein [Actinomycetota bacterium]